MRGFASVLEAHHLLGLGRGRADSFVIELVGPVFGYAQQLFTRLVDERGQAILNAVGGAAPQLETRVAEG